MTIGLNFSNTVQGFFRLWLGSLVLASPLVALGCKHTQRNERYTAGFVEHLGAKDLALPHLRREEGNPAHPSRQVHQQKQQQSLLFPFSF